MPRYEYKVIPAPAKGVKARGVRNAEARFANALQAIMNEHGADGWAYLRADTLPSEERHGLTGRTSVYRNMLVFQRELSDEPDAMPVLLAPVARVVPSLSRDFASDNGPQKPAVETEGAKLAAPVTAKLVAQAKPSD